MKNIACARHFEEHYDEAIRNLQIWIASLALAMTLHPETHMPDTTTVTLQRIAESEAVIRPYVWSR